MGGCGRTCSPRRSVAAIGFGIFLVAFSFAQFFLLAMALILPDRLLPDAPGQRDQYQRDASTTGCAGG
ncbi:MAG: hypothetical protein U1F24_10490 [Alphaproteobacteria bacterium]